MDGHFDELLRRIKLTKLQREDAKRKYTGIAKKLHDKYYVSEYNGNTKLIIGSYGKKTNIRPPGDVDLLFKIPLETYERFFEYKSNGPASLLQEIKGILAEKYTTTDSIKAWGKVVLVEFSDGTHNVELLPAIEIDGVFIIPNSENDGSWDSFDVRTEIDALSESNNSTNGLTRRLIRIMKCWKQQNSTMTLKSYQIEELCIKFLEQFDSPELSSMGNLISELLEWLHLNTEVDMTNIRTAYSRAQKALIYEANGQFIEACNEWKKIFGESNFPSYSGLREKIHKLRLAYPSQAEEFIEDIHKIRIDPAVKLSIDAKVNPNRKGFRNIEWPIVGFLKTFSAIPTQSNIYFTAQTNITGLKYLWKIRNFGNHALRENGLRGQIKQGSDDGRWREPTKYHGSHYVECYAIQNDICVAIARVEVPINIKLESEYE